MPPIPLTVCIIDRSMESAIAFPKQHGYVPGTTHYNVGLFVIVHITDSKRPGLTRSTHRRIDRSWRAACQINVTLKPVRLAPRQKARSSLPSTLKSASTLKIAGGPISGVTGKSGA